MVEYTGLGPPPLEQPQGSATGFATALRRRSAVKRETWWVDQFYNNQPRWRMICRIWHGWTVRGNADAYQELLRTQIFPGIQARGIAGFQGIDLLRCDAGSLVEFVTIMWFDSLDEVKAFAGPDYSVAVVPPSARALLARFDERVAHYDVLERRRP